VEKVEQDNTPRNYTIKDFQRIISICKKRSKRWK
jgi:hypothetical protein